MADEGLDNIDISALMRSYDDGGRRSLKELFDLKLVELNINQTQALEAMDIQSRALLALLSGTSSRVDIVSLIKLARFLDIPQSDAVTLYLNSLLKEHNEEKIQDVEKRKFILQNFDVSELKKEGVLSSATDFDVIENELVSILSYDSIFDYRRDVINPLYSSSKLYSKNPMCDYWIDYSRQVFRKTNNTNPFDRKALIDYFPTIRWHSMNVEKGIWEVIRALYRMGITIMYLPKFKKLHIRGATFSVNKKPCIVLTDYKGYYPTLWFALLHELHHVLFDWEDILVNSFHVSDKTSLYAQVELEDVADQFAKDYLFSDQKMQEILPRINDPFYVKEYSKMNHVHHSIPYAFWAFENNKWGWVDKFMPPIEECLGKVRKVSFRMRANEVAKFNIENLYS